MSAQRREQQPQYFHPRDVEGYWRSAVRREMEKMEEINPEIFNIPANAERATA